MTALTNRIERLLHPQFGIARDIMDSVEPGKGAPDRNDKLIPVSVGEIREVHAILELAVAALTKTVRQ